MEKVSKAESLLLKVLDSMYWYEIEQEFRDSVQYIADLKDATEYHPTYKWVKRPNYDQIMTKYR